LTRYRKTILFGCLGLLLIFVIGVGAVGFLAHQTGIFAKDKISHLRDQVNESLSTVDVEQTGVVHGLWLNLASGWVKQNLASAETLRFWQGLSCIDAVGGPSPEAIINHVRTQVNDATHLARLDELIVNIEESALKANSSASCASWILSG
jgi:hypothetical protein